MARTELSSGPECNAITGPSNSNLFPEGTSGKGIPLVKRPLIEAGCVQSPSAVNKHTNSPRHFCAASVPTLVGNPGIFMRTAPTLWIGFEALHRKTPARSESPKHSKPCSDIFPSFSIIVPCASRDGGVACGSGLVRKSCHPAPDGLYTAKWSVSRTKRIDSPEIESLSSAKSKNFPGCFHTNRFSNDKD